MSENGEGFQPQPINVETVKTESKAETIEKALKIADQVGVSINMVKHQDLGFNDNVDQKFNRFKGEYNATTGQPGSQDLKYKVEPIIKDISKTILIIKSMVNNFGLDQINVRGRLENILQKISSIDDMDQIKPLVIEATQVFKNNVDKLSSEKDQSRRFKVQLNDSAQENEMTIRKIINNNQYDLSIKPGSRSQALLERCQISSKFLASQIDNGVQISNQTDFSFKNNIHENQRQFTDILQSLTKPKN